MAAYLPPFNGPRPSALPLLGLLVAVLLAATPVKAGNGHVRSRTSPPLPPELASARWPHYPFSTTAASPSWTRSPVTSWSRFSARRRPRAWTPRWRISSYISTPANTWIARCCR